MNKIIFQKTKIYLSRLGYKKISSIKEIREGVNSNVYKVKVNNIFLILKFFNNKNKSRIKREILFYNFLNKIKNKQVIRPISFNLKLNMAVYPYIKGSKIKKIKNTHVKELSDFLNQINKKRILYKTLIPLAIDGIRNRLEHFKLCEKKINQIKLIKFENVINKDLNNFLINKLIPKFNEIKKKYKKNKLQKLLSIKLSKKKMIISPSDFGFHNIIQSKKKLFFIDFEFAGYDDPVKLICDFYCQPDQTLSSYQKRMFIKKISFQNYSLKELDLNTKFFLPFHKIKWCCIILNIFKNKKFQNNKNLSYKRNKLMKIQLNKAKIYFKKNFE